MPVKKIALREFVLDSGECRGVVRAVFLDTNEAASRADGSDSGCPASQVGIEHRRYIGELGGIHAPLH